MDKGEVVDALIEALKEELRKSVDASKDAASYATDEEARAESKWDTQGLEASYLAAGQASQARQWAESISLLQESRNALVVPQTEVTLGALVTCEFDDSEEDYFIAPAAGGHVLRIGEREVTVVTARSPIVARIFGKREGEGFTFANGAAGSILRIR